MVVAAASLAAVVALGSGVRAEDPPVASVTGAASGQPDVPTVSARDAAAAPEHTGDTAPAAGLNDKRTDDAHPKRKPRKPKLAETSTLAEWKAASASARSEVSVAIARRKLPATATKLEIATAAMEISGCVTKTASDARFDAWQVAPTATTCLTAPERPAPGGK
jgi:hypothetical protein